MTLEFFANAENRIILQICRTSPGFIPIVMSGKLHPVRETSDGDYPVSSDLTAQDFVLGLEVLGCRVVRGENGNVLVREPSLFRSDAWRDRARQIQAMIIDTWEGKRTEVFDILHTRDDAL